MKITADLRLLKTIIIFSRFPGIQSKDDILSFLTLMASKNPVNDIAAKILLHQGFDPCSKFPENSTFWTKITGCDAGFIPDHKNGYCYMLLPNTENLEDGDNFCRNNYDAELIMFDSNSEVDGFISLINKGTVKPTLYLEEMFVIFWRKYFKL